MIDEKRAKVEGKVIICLKCGKRMVKDQLEVKGQSYFCPRCETWLGWKRSKKE